MDRSARTVGAAVRSVRDRFRQGALLTPELDARRLAEAAFGMDGLALALRENDALPDWLRTDLDDFAVRRLAGEPVARILGEQEFYGLPFALNGATLVPRPETELLVDMGLHLLHGRDSAKILDLGTGSGCIAITLLTRLETATAVAVDLSDEALSAAIQNGLRHGVAPRLSLRQGSWFVPVAGEVFELIVSNPPYIESAAIAGLQPEVRTHDPRLALDGGADGLSAYRAIILGASAHLAPGGALLLEIGSTQGSTVADLLFDAGFSDVRIEKDLAGLDRAVLGHHSLS